MLANLTVGRLHNGSDKANMLLRNLMTRWVGSSSEGNPVCHNTFNWHWFESTLKKLY